MANQNALYAYQYLQRKYGYSPEQAAGIVGNLIQESSMNTGAINHGDGSDGSNSIGIGQWNGARARGLQSFAADNGGDANSLDTQLDYIHHELNTSEKAAGNRLANANTVEGATAAMIGYERPQGWSADNPTAGHGWNNRLNNALGIFGNTGDTSNIVAQNSSTPLFSTTGGNQSNGSAQPASSSDSAPAANTSHNGILVQAFNKLTGNNYQVPDTILGANTADVMKGFTGLGDFAKALSQNDADINKQIQAGAARAGGRSSQPVELSFFSSLPEDQRKKKRGGIAGLGGYTI